MDSFDPAWRFNNGWNRAQARAAVMLDAEVANLNTGSYGPLPHAVFDYANALRRRLAEEPMDFLVRQYPGLLWQAREALAHFLGGDPRRLVMTANVSVAINNVASMLTLAAPGEILMTDREYGAMQWCWERAARRQGLSVRLFHLPVRAEDPGEIIDAFAREIRPQTRLLFFSHVVSQSGLVMPAKEICALARKKRVLTMVDGAHAPAMVPSAAGKGLDDIAADFYGGNCHKWLLAPTGSGFLYLGAGNEDRLQPMQVSWGYHPNPALGPDDRDEFGSTPRLRFFEFEATRDPCAWAALPAAIDFQTALGWDKIREANEDLVQYLREKMTRFARLKILTPANRAMHGFLTAWDLPGDIDATHWRQTLWNKHRIEAPVFEGLEGLILRVSTHFYNTREEIDRLIDALAELTN